MADDIIKPQGLRDMARVHARRQELERKAQWDALDRAIHPLKYLTHEMTAAEVDAAATTNVDDSDASLGRQHRARLTEFAKRRAEDQRDMRESEWVRWRTEADNIQRGRMRKATKRRLASLVKDSLDLPDSIETIRKKL